MLTKTVAQQYSLDKSDQLICLSLHGFDNSID